MVRVSAHAVERYRERLEDSGDFVSTRAKLKRSLEGVVGKFLEDVQTGSDFRIHISGITYCLVKDGEAANVVTCFRDMKSQKLNRYRRSR